MTARTESGIAPDERSFVATRLIAAPRALVFDAWTEAEHLAQWWGAKGCTVLSCEAACRPGGFYRLTLRSPTGEEQRVRGVYLEIDLPDRLLLTCDHIDAVGNPSLEGLIIIDLAAQEGETKLVMQARFVEVAAPVAALDHVEADWRQGLDRLEDYLARACVAAG